MVILVLFNKMLEENHEHYTMSNEENTVLASNYATKIENGLIYFDMNNWEKFISTFDVYPCLCYEHDGFYKCQTIEENIVCAINYLRVDRLKTILDSMSTDEILNLKLFDKSIMQFFHEFNMFDYKYNRKLNKRCCRVNKYILKDSAFKTNSICSFYLEMLRLICSKCPKMITKQMMNGVTAMHVRQVMDVYTDYYTDDDDTECCFLCYSNHDNELIDNICHCKNKVHIQCLQKLVSTNGPICTVCKYNLRPAIHSNEIYFPYDGIYHLPLMQDCIQFIKKDDFRSSLSYATAYLHVDLVEEILNMMTSEQLKKYRKTADFYAIYQFQKDDPDKWRLKDNMYTNLSRYNNPEKYLAIENLYNIKL